MTTFQMRLNKSAQSQATKAAVAFKTYKALMATGDALDRIIAQTEMNMALYHRRQAMQDRTWAQCAEYRG